MTNVTPLPTLLPTFNDKRRGNARTQVFMLVYVRDEPMWAFDVGMGGVMCYTNRFYRVGQYLDLSFRLPGDDTLFNVGGQVAGLDDNFDTGNTVRIRFCRPTRKLWFAVYRLLDSRRGLWDEEVKNRLPPPCPYRSLERPFEALLLESFAALRLKEVNRPGLSAACRAFQPSRIGPSRDLAALSRVLASDSEPARAA